MGAWPIERIISFETAELWEEKKPREFPVGLKVAKAPGVVFPDTLRNLLSGRSGWQRSGRSSALAVCN
jgi:hypothetical protein